MKTLYLIATCLFLFSHANAQDFIIKKNGDEIQSKVIEVGTSEIKYKKFENQDGPSYAILKREVFMIKYGDGSKDVINAISESKEVEPNVADETEMEPATEPKVKPTSSQPSKTSSYLDRVREVQAKDPGISFCLGNGWLGNDGIGNPLFALDVKFPRKNVFMRGLSLGARVSFAGLTATMKDYDGGTGTYTEIYGFGLSAKYYAPLPIKKIQPYVVAVVGAAYKNHHYNHTIVDGTWVGPPTDSGIDPYVGFGVGSNFMLIKNIGFFVEFGYFTTAYINTGLIFKFGRTVQ